MDHKICTAGNIKVDEDNYEESRMVCKNWYNKKKRKTKFPFQSLIELPHQNNLTFIVGITFRWEKLSYAEILTRVNDRDVYLFTKSPLNNILIRRSNGRKKRRK